MSSSRRNFLTKFDRQVFRRFLKDSKVNCLNSSNADIKVLINWSLLSLLSLMFMKLKNKTYLNRYATEIESTRAVISASTPPRAKGVSFNRQTLLNQRNRLMQRVISLRLTGLTSPPTFLQKCWNLIKYKIEKPDKSIWFWLN